MNIFTTVYLYIRCICSFAQELTYKMRPKDKVNKEYFEALAFQALRMLKKHNARLTQLNKNLELRIRRLEDLLKEKEAELQYYFLKTEADEPEE